jgi:hypothetical protein
MNREEILERVIVKREFSKLPKKDIELAINQFEKTQVSDEERIRLIRELLHKVFGAFSSKKLLSLKDKPYEWILRKHLSTRERLPFYKEVYNRIFKKDKEAIIFDLGAGINGFSYNYLEKNFKYLGIEAVGQLTDLMNYFFKKEKINGKAIHLSLFELEKIKSLIKKEKGKKVLFLFKVLDSLEMLEKDYSKKLLLELIPLVDKVVVSFATRSMISRKKFNVNRKWILEFINNNFQLLDDFELGSERYIIFSK